MKLFFILLTLIIGLVYLFMAGHPDFVDEKYLFYVSRIFWVFAGVIAVRAITYLAVEKKFGSDTQKNPSELMRVIVSGFLYAALGGLLMKFAFNMNIAALLTTSALLTAVVGFALQATLGNIFSGLSLQVEQIFYIGDTVRLKNIVGAIEALTWRSVSIRTLSGALIVVPNGKISSADVEVFHKGRPVWVKIKICAPISHPPQKVREIVTRVVLSVPQVDDSRPVIVNMTDMDPDDRLNLYDIIFFCKDFMSQFPAMAAVKERIWYAFLRNGVDVLNVWKKPGVLTAPHFFEKQKPHSDLRPGDYSKILFSSPVLKPLDKHEKTYLADHMETLMFSNKEPIVFEKRFKHAMFIIAAGRARREYMPEVSQECALPDEEEAAEASEFLWSSEALEEISRHFVPLVGPIGRTLVRQAARRTLDPIRLHTLLAAELEDEKDRERFLEHVPELCSKTLYPGDFFGEIRLLTGLSKGLSSYEAVGHVDLIAIRPPLMKEILERRPSLSRDFSEIIREHHENEAGFETLFGKEGAEKEIVDQIRSFYGL